MVISLISRLLTEWRRYITGLEAKVGTLQALLVKVHINFFEMSLHLLNL